MQPLRYSINVTLDGCCDHRAIVADEELHRHASDNLARADALLFGRVVYEMMEDAWRVPARTGVRPDCRAFGPFLVNHAREYKEMKMAPFRIAAFSGIAMLGALTLASVSFAAEPKSATAAQFKKMDQNKDRKVSASEHAAGAKQMFDTMDGNKDGKVTAAEMDAAHQRVTGRKATKSDMTAVDKIKVVDTDGDGVLTAEEHAVGSRAMFEMMDSDKNGFLTKDELAAGHARMLKKPLP